MARKSKRDWFVAGMELLGEVGPNGITIDALCQKLSVTKGSFYHHFQNYDDFKTGFLLFYEEEGTLDVITSLADLPTAEAKLCRLLDTVVRATDTAVPEIQLRAWAIQDETVRAVQMRVDSRRREYVQTLCAEIGGDPTQATVMSNMLYAILIGAEQTIPAMLGDELRTLFEEFLHLHNITPPPT